VPITSRVRIALPQKSMTLQVLLLQKWLFKLPNKASSCHRPRRGQRRSSQPTKESARRRPPLTPKMRPPAGDGLLKTRPLLIGAFRISTRERFSRLQKQPKPRGVSDCHMATTLSKRNRSRVPATVRKLSGIKAAEVLASRRKKSGTLGSLCQLGCSPGGAVGAGGGVHRVNHRVKAAYLL